ncbi:MAG: hypothetical protein AMJ92_02295 [candidate division Zixibacteria bacterium SM23_81]|nr:MAG: hypothetical protein AMJ92_02295 [candidate division Zixibacteria bacterium SM23_81]
MKAHFQSILRSVFPLSFTLIISVSLTVSLPSVAGAGFSAERAGFIIKFRDEVSPYRIMSAFVLPGEELAIRVENPPPQEQYLMRTSAGALIDTKTAHWRWRAPEKPELYPLQIVHPASADSIVLNVFVMVPFDHLKGEELNGYRIGKYPSIPLKQLPIYKPPQGFIEVTEENQETLISPHFKLKNFLCKQEDGYPKYLVLKERLLLKLELILEKTNGKGYNCPSFHIMSGYRTPYYNKLIGNVKYSRHLWGGAADIFIDENPQDGMMDDLNRDGHIDYRDAGILYDIIDQMYGRPWYEMFLGGLGRYKKTKSHGPFVHVDVRGFRARWGE